MIYRYKVCPHCGRSVKLNGCGSDATYWQRRLRDTLRFVNPVTWALFNNAADEHDLLYHMAGSSRVGLSRERNRELDDAEFLKIALFSVDNPDSVQGLSRFEKWTIRKFPSYFRGKAYEYHGALRWKGGDVYPKYPCTAPERANDLE